MDLLNLILRICRTYPINYHLYIYYKKSNIHNFRIHPSKQKVASNLSKKKYHPIHPSIPSIKPEDPLMARQVSSFGVKTSPGPAKRSMIPSLDSSCSRPAKTMHLLVFGIVVGWGRFLIGGSLAHGFFWKVLVRYLGFMMNHRCSKSSSIKMWWVGSCRHSSIWTSEGVNGGFMAF